MVKIERITAENIKQGNIKEEVRLDLEHGWRYLMLLLHRRPETKSRLKLYQLTTPLGY
jgi:hypothetical protein